MRVIKGILAFLLAIILIISASLALGSYAVSEAISEDAVEKAITETDAVGQLTDNIIQQNTVNLGGVYGETMQSVLKSDAMTAFFTEYTARCLQSQVYGEGMEEVGSDDLNMAFSQGMDECLANGTISMNEGERKMFDDALNAAMPNLTKGVNYVLNQMDLDAFVDEETAEQIEMARTVTSAQVRYGAAGIAIMACLLIVALYWGSKIGLILCGVIILVIAAFLFILSMMIDQTVDATGDGMVLSRQMLYVMVTYGVQSAMKVGAVVGGAMIIAFPVFRLIFRSR
ncbi:MAG: hypothetical protein E7221_06965 [Clostridiales bacterium]|nr:hypothetical protein [Clostridiales bacterium]MBQ3322784.1 hypothetical protein [Bacillota bacterium]